MKGSTQQDVDYLLHEQEDKTAIGLQRREPLFQSMVYEKLLQENWTLNELRLEDQARFGEVRQKQESIRISLIKLHSIHYYLLNSHSV